jgi:hypothetical protein
MAAEEFDLLKKSALTHIIADLEAVVDPKVTAAQAAQTAAEQAETNAAASETAAGTSKTNAASSETAAEAAKTAVEAITNFTNGNVYQGNGTGIAALSREDFGNQIELVDKTYLQFNKALLAWDNFNRPNGSLGNTDSGITWGFYGGEAHDILNSSMKPKTANAISYISIPSNVIPGTTSWKAVKLNCVINNIESGNGDEPIDYVILVDDLNYIGINVTLSDIEFYEVVTGTKQVLQTISRGKGGLGFSALYRSMESQVIIGAYAGNRFTLEYYDDIDRVRYFFTQPTANSVAFTKVGFKAPSEVTRFQNGIRAVKFSQKY